jgi:nitrosocyanin
MNKNMLLASGAVVVVVLVGGFLLMNKSGAPAAAPSESTPAMEKTGSVTASPVDAMTAGSTKTFSVESSSFKFTPAEITVKKGDTVKITFTNKELLHNFSLDEFNVKTGQLAAGKSETVTFTADKTGTFEYYCNVGSHRSMGMVGKLIVE